MLHQEFSEIQPQITSRLVFNVVDLNKDGCRQTLTFAATFEFGTLNRIIGKNEKKSCLLHLHATLMESIRMI